MGKGTTVESDPAIGKAAESNAAIANRAQDLAEQNWNWNKSLTEKYAPIYDQILQSSLDQSNQNADQSAAQWDQYTKVFQPIENQMASEAVNYDSPEETARREALAAADVGTQFDASTAQTAREMGRMGVSPTSSMGLQQLTDQGNAEALAKAGAITKARNDTKLLGMSLRQSAAQFGRNQTQTGLAASAAALQGGNSAAGIMGSQTAQGNAAGTTQGLMGTAISGNNSAANILQNQFNTKVQAQSAADSGLGSLIGTGLTAAAMWKSSKEVKEDKQPVDDHQALAGLMKVPVDSWKYKDGVADSGEHEGPYAEDMQKQFGNGVAPGGVGLDPISVSGTHHAAIRALGEDMKQVKQKLGLTRVPIKKNARPVSNKTPGNRSVSGGPSKNPRLPRELEGDMTPGLVGLTSE